MRGSARPLLVLDCQAPLLLGCVPHRDVSPFSYDTGRGVRAASLASHGQSAVPFNPRGRAHAGYIPWLPTLPPAPLLLSTPYSAASSPARPAAAYPAASLELRRLQRAPAAACSTCCSYTRSSTHSAATPLRRLLVLLPLLPALILPLPRPPLPCELAARLASARQRTHTNSFFKLRRLFLPRDPFTAATASPIDFPGSSTHVGLAHQP